ncbi:hypothetical protein GUA87_15815 [Sneathiella sp. P13V-1]|uniref:phospholipase effector Tle1 domain-containing protein n=1 Tax=Sneathiella sp. P13V-1 TaxID=2697366 RepID=UPI00187B3248|nr:DUF2235 domain-containing protein [Sneathiella sp. P13V-1]MBE7638325.1 hypothetical protein [Sneathiella sp. P13V-1]
MSRKLVIFNDCSWIPPQSRSKQRNVPGNASLASQCLLPETLGGVDQISFIQEDGPKFGLRTLLNRHLGLGIRKEVLSAYRFLIQNYIQGDEIYLFGAGRGGYVMHKLAELISISGLVSAGSVESISKAYVYAQLDEQSRNGPSGQAVRVAFSSQQVPIHMLGCWDIVGHKGVPNRVMKHLSRLWLDRLDNTISQNIKSAYHALSLDEDCRHKAPHIWTGVQSNRSSVVEQVWFAGRHQNITGGRRDCRLSDIALRWMISKAQTHGLEFDPEKVEEITSPDPMGTMAPPQKEPSQRHRRPGHAETHFARKQLAGSEKIHHTVFKKQQADADYAPKALASLPAESLGVSYDLELKQFLNRKHNRLVVNSPASVLLDKRRYNGNMLDISEGGARVWLQLDVPVGTIITLRSSALDEKDITGEVVWTKDNTLGVEFQQSQNLHAEEPASTQTLH